MKFFPYIILFFSIHLSGEEIKGAFGYMLGSKYIVENPKPKTPFRNFKNIELIKDQIGKVYQIKSKVSFSSWEETEKEYKTIQYMLTKKYPRKEFEIYHSESKTINLNTSEYNATFTITAREYKKRKLDRETQIELKISDHRTIELIYTDNTRENKANQSEYKANAKNYNGI